MKSKKEKLGEFKFSWKLLEKLPGTVKEERKHRSLRREHSLECLQASEKGKKSVWNRTLKKSGIKIGIESSRGSRLTHLSVHSAHSHGVRVQRLDYIIFSPSSFSYDPTQDKETLKCPHLLTGPSFPKPGQERVSSCHPLSLH